MTKRSKVGANTRVYVALEGTVLSMSKGKNASSRQHIDVRTTPVIVDIPGRELRVAIRVGDKDKLLRLALPSEEATIKWKNAIENALHSDINEQYTFGKTLGSGAFGEVVLAVHKLTKAQRAVKIINPGTTTKSREHLKSEVEVMKTISHPNIVHTYQIFDLKRITYIVMEYVSGGDLFDFVAQYDSLTEKQSSETLRSIFRAVEYLHRNSIVHRDLKPENILCVNNTWPLHLKVTDFGFANFLDPCGDADDTMRTPVGTVYFMAPEIITNKGYGPAVDTWACGVLLYTILTGRLPFPGKNTTEYMRNVAIGKPLFPTFLWHGISEDARSLIKGLLNPDPNKRLTALGALQHRWIAWPDAIYGQNEIRRDRSNLHSDRRQLFKARTAVIAVAMANKFRATIPHMVDSLGDSTKKVAGALESGVKKTAGGIERGIGEIASGVVRLGDGIGEGTRKVACDIGDGTKKVAGGIAGGTRKVADGIGHGAKVAKVSVGSGVKFVGDGVKKTAGGIERGVKSTAGGIGHGAKATGDRFKRGVELVVKERNRDSESGRSNVAGMNSSTDSTRRVARAMMLHSLRKQSEPSRSVSDQSQPLPVRTELANDINEDDSSSDFVSAMEEHSETEEGWGNINVGKDCDSSRGRLHRSNARRLKSPPKSTTSSRIAESVSCEIEKNTPLPQWNENPGTKRTARPNLTPLSGVTLGWSDETMFGSPERYGTVDHERCDDDRMEGPTAGMGLTPGGGTDLFMKTTALLLAAKAKPPNNEQHHEGPVI